MRRVVEHPVQPIETIHFMSSPPGNPFGDCDAIDAEVAGCAAHRNIGMSVFDEEGQREP